MDEMARRADDVARTKPDKEKTEEIVFFGVFAQRTHPHVRMTGVMIQPKIAKTNSRISVDLFRMGSPLRALWRF